VAGRRALQSKASARSALVFASIAPKQPSARLGRSSGHGVWRGRRRAGYCPRPRRPGTPPCPPAASSSRPLGGPRSAPGSDQDGAYLKLLAASRLPHAFPRIPLLPYLPGLHLHLTCPWAVAVRTPGSIGAKTSAGLCIMGLSVCGHQVVWHRLTGAFLRCNYFTVSKVH
jgi:hypothetical protein